MSRFIIYRWHFFYYQQTRIRGPVIFVEKTNDTLCTGSAGGKQFNQWSLLKITWLLSTLLWYCLVQNENMQRPHNHPLKHTRIKGKEGGKTNWNLFHEELKGQSDYIHYHRAYVKQCTICTLWGKVQNWKGVTAEDQCNFVICKNFLSGCVKV